ncbi:acetyltransferase [Bacillus coahuilensis m2-6]|nr:GNAT family N-acetyltransferase [Bacillus coahuilensis]KUP08459.1 acetyltransferase [Bacillus coahuilensis m2-6]
MHTFLTIDENNLLDTFSLFTQLRTDLSQQEYKDLFKVMKSEGYQMIGLVDKGDIKVLAGYAIRTNFYNKRHLYLYDLVAATEDRSKGYGNKMMQYLEQIASVNDCKFVALESGLMRVDAHRFYEDKNNYERFCYSFRKSIL